MRAKREQDQDVMRVFFLEGYAAGIEAMRSVLVAAIDGTMQADDREHVVGVARDVADRLVAKNAKALAGLKAKLPEGK